MRLISFAIYLGIGAMLHAMFIGAQFDWSSAWTFGWLFGWPLMLIASLWVFALGATVVAVVVWCLYAWLQTFAEWRQRRRLLAAYYKRNPKT